MFNPDYLTISLFSLLVEMKLNEKKQKLVVSLCFPNWIHLSLVLFWDDKLQKVRLIFPTFPLHWMRSLERQYRSAFIKMQSSYPSG